MHSYPLNRKQLADMLKLSQPLDVNDLGSGVTLHMALYEGAQIYLLENLHGLSAVITNEDATQEIAELLEEG